VKKRFWLGLGLLCLLGILFLASHSTHYRYNDWFVLNSSIEQVQRRYGDFDLGRVHPGSSGRVGYYIYKDTRGIMPDYLEHYYYMDYDETGRVYHVFDGCQPGG